MRERDERDARFFAWDVPGDAHIVALVHDTDEAERSATVADAIATSVARRREHTLLLSATPGPSPLDELLGGGGSPGLPAALEGRARLTDVAVQRVDRPFVYLPAGRDAAAMGDLLGDDLLTSFISRVRERGGTLFIVLSGATPHTDRLASLLDGYVALGEVALPDALRHLSQFGRVRFDDAAGGDERDGGARDDRAARPSGPAAEEVASPADGPPIAAPEAETSDGGAPGGARVAAAGGGGEAAEPAGTAEETAAGTEAHDGPEDAPRPTPAPWTRDAVADEPEADPSAPGGAWSRHRSPVRFPAGRAAVGVAVLAGVALAWWLVARATDRPDGAGPAPAEAAPAAGSGAAAAPEPFDAAGASRAFDAAPALGRSVLIASYADRPDAEERLARLRGRSDGFFFLSPTPVRGVVYHRVFAGAAADAAEGRALMTDLVARGLKDAASEWDVRPAGLAFDLGLYGRRDRAAARVLELTGLDIPAYALFATAGADTVWRVYGGAYENERASGPLAEMLEAAGEPAVLVERRGSIPLPPPEE